MAINNSDITLTIKGDATEYLHTMTNELLAKTYAYELVNTEDMKKTTGKIKALGFDHVVDFATKDATKNGIYIYGVKHSNPEYPVTILCRGTQLDLSILQDLDPNGPGHTIIQRNKKNILKRIENLLQASFESLNIPTESVNLTGHSLGGAVAQIIAGYLLENKKEFLESGKSDYPNLAKVKNIKIEIFQPAGVSEGVAKKIKEDAISINTLKIKKNESCNIEITAHIKENDIVPQVSGARILSDVTEDIAKVKLKLWDLNSTIKTTSIAPTKQELFSLVKNSIKSGLNPAYISSSIASILYSRLVSTIIGEHTSGFNFDAVKFPMKNPSLYYDNTTEEGREKIKKFYERCIMTDLKQTDGGQFLFDMQKSMYSVQGRLDSGYYNEKLREFKNFVKQEFPTVSEFVSDMVEAYTDAFTKSVDYFNDVHSISRIQLRDFVISTQSWTTSLKKLVENVKNLNENITVSDLNNLASTLKDPSSLLKNLPSKETVDDIFKKSEQVVKNMRQAYINYNKTVEGLKDSIKIFKNTNKNLLQANSIECKNHQICANAISQAVSTIEERYKNLCENLNEETIAQFSESVLQLDNLFPSQKNEDMSKDFEISLGEIMESESKENNPLKKNDELSHAFFKPSYESESQKDQKNTPINRSSFSKKK